MGEAAEYAFAQAPEKDPNSTGAVMVKRAVLADPRAWFLGVLRVTAAVFPAPFEILFLRVFCDTARARKTLAPLFKFFP